MNPKVILLVEDNPSDIALTQRAFAKSRIVNELVIAEDGQEALDYLFAAESFKGRVPNEVPTLVLLDIKMPRVDGFEVLRQIRANSKTSRIPVVILTTSKEEQDIAQGYDLGVNSYLRKPVDFINFMESVEHLGLYWLVMNEPPPSKGK